MTDDRLAEALRSMQPEVGAAETELALADLHQRSVHLGRRRRVTQTLIGVAAVLAVAAGTVGLLGRDTGDPGLPVLTDGPTTTAPSTTTTPSVPTSEPPIWNPPEPTPAPRLTQGELDQVVGVELRTWWMPGSDPEHWNGFWQASPGVVDEVVAALGADTTRFEEPEVGDRATIRFELSDGTYRFRDVDLEAGWIEPDQRLAEDVLRQLRTGFNDAVGVPWDEPERLDPTLDSALDRALPASALDAIVDRLQSELDANRSWEYERWFVELWIEGHGPIVEVRQRGVGDDSGRGVDYRFALVETPDGWAVGGRTSRWLCLRSTPIEMGDIEGNWGCL